MRCRGGRGDGRSVGILSVVILTALALRLTNANPAQSQTTILRAWRVDRVESLDPGDRVWDEIEPAAVPLTAQLGFYTAGGGSIPMVLVKAVHTEERLFVRIEWADGSRDISSQDAVAFADAVAVEFPSQAGSSVPAVCMGQADGGVNIWQWRADRQPSLAAANGDRRPAADFYPSEEDLWFPAREAGNPYATGAINPVQNLVARSFGTIGPAREQPVSGGAVYGQDGWSAVFSRSFVAPGKDQPGFAVGQRADIAFAVWDGRNRDRDGQKQVSQFVQMSMTAASPPSQGWDWVPMTIGLLLAASILVLLVRGARSP